ncbi:sulfotransferase [Oleiagrimonas sp. MCCC 1A03011]|uniref:sulfotransferase n=1 Tax=Oleiagrimonas sp. MCCC 1A03011 TaxID=1926883 RepID=UPI000DC3CBEB|nr:sulfotransferase [Oleiagrimonas sp. MCCC 1A03011]RAP58435.1 hypothetical protein BTJ49_05685 [Oleiagrimonas sp. MCCC 1A03011]
MKAAGQIFVTGMLRSGTSLLQTVLTNHPEVFVVYQPFHQLYVDVKAYFLQTKGIERPLPLGDGTDGAVNEDKQFFDWLRETRFDRGQAERLIRRSVIGKGGSCRTLSEELPVISGTFHELLECLYGALARHFGRSSAHWLGSKEVLCEEYIPYLIRRQTRCLLIVRDPRAVIASANSGRYRDIVGDCYPTLMLARIWRKSVAYALSLGASPHVQVVRYEDLTQSTAQTLDTISRFLDVTPFATDALKGPLLDHAGAPWLGNSSFGDKKAIDAQSTSAWSAHLPDSMIDLIEALCYPEMLALGYEPQLAPGACAHVIETAQEDTQSMRASYLNDYSLNDIERGRELARWGAILAAKTSDCSHGLNVLDGVQSKLIAAMHA